MALAANARLGPYEIDSPLGAGGMGEVYRARDPRLGRDVAVKVLPASLSTDRSRLMRFEQEARAAALLNHPNILAVYDIGTQDGAPYIVSELLEGETLRAKIQLGALPVRKATDYALQVARGLAAAHDKGIVHRDLKPENIFITRDGRVKILDFGLAKLVESAFTSAGENITQTQASDPGTVLGTVGYMSPEQVRGKAADARSDLFAFGAILYEMLSGRRAFHGESPGETMSAILREEPPDLTETNRTISPALERIVRHCLEKSPDERFQSARDVAFDLELVSQTSASQLVPVVQSQRERRLRFVVPLLGIALIALVAAAGFLIGKRGASVPPPPYHQLTFRRGYVDVARFAPDGQTILYDANWDGGPFEVYSGRADAPNSLSLGLRNVKVLAISSTGEVAVMLNRRSIMGWSQLGTLARTAITGGTPRPVLDNVSDVAWTPDGKDLAIVRYQNQRFRLEYPIGKVLYETSGWIGNLRFNTKGDELVFAEHPVMGDDRGGVSVVDLAGHHRELAKDYASIQGLAWHPLRNEIWYTASDSGIITALRSVDLNGKSRVLARAPGRLMLQDVAQDGRVLIAQVSGRRGMMVSTPGQSAERDIALLDWSLVADLSPDGKTVLFSEEGEGGGPHYGVYLRKTDGSEAVRIGDGGGQALSPDGKYALAINPDNAELSLLPTGAGERRILPGGKVHPQTARFTPDGSQIVLGGEDESGKPRTYIEDLNTGSVRPLTPPGLVFRLVSPDGKYTLNSDENDKFWLYPIAGGNPRALGGNLPGDEVAGWSSDGRYIYVCPRLQLPAKLSRVDVNTGERDLFKEIAPADVAGIPGVGPVVVSGDGKTYIYGFTRLLSDLYVMDPIQ